MRDKPNVPVTGKRFGNSGRVTSPVPIKRYLEPLAARMRISSDDIAEVHLYPGLIRFKVWSRHADTGEYYRDDSGEVASKIIEFPVDTEGDDLQGALHDYRILRKRFEGIPVKDPVRGKGQHDPTERIGPIPERPSASLSAVEPEPEPTATESPEGSQAGRVGRITGSTGGG